MEADGFLDTKSTSVVERSWIRVALLLYEDLSPSLCSFSFPLSRCVPPRSVILVCICVSSCHAPVILVRAAKGAWRIWLALPVGPREARLQAAAPTVHPQPKSKAASCFRYQPNPFDSYLAKRSLAHLLLFADSHLFTYLVSWLTQSVVLQLWCLLRARHRFFRLRSSISPHEFPACAIVPISPSPQESNDFASGH